MSTPKEIIVLRAPQYSGESRLDDLITLAGEQTGTAYGGCRNLAIALLVLHWLTLETQNNGSAGSVKSEKEGDLQITYNTSVGVSQKYPDLSQTSYGLELIRLRKSCLLTPRNRTIPIGS